MDTNALNYIIDYEDKSISYFNVIKSDRNLSKKELYNIVERYFTYAYNSGKSVIKSRDKENCVIVGKGLYSKIHIYNGATTETYDVYHILRIDCRDGRIRVTFTINDYNIFREGKVVKYVVIKSKDFSRYPTDYRPFGTEKDEEMDECLEKLERRIVAQFEEI